MSLDLDLETDCYYCEVTTTEWLNDSLNGTTSPSPADWEWPSLLVMSVTSTVLGLMILATIIGECEGGNRFLFKPVSISFLPNSRRPLHRRLPFFVLHIKSQRFLLSLSSGPRERRTLIPNRHVILNFVILKYF
jgi:hypothetical protein